MTRARATARSCAAPLRARRPAATRAWLAAACALTVAVSCLTFDGLGVPSAPSAGYLGAVDAARACSLMFTCPGLATSVAVSLALPLETPSAPPSLNFASCVDWMSGPIPPSRPGFSVQQATLACIAQKPSCAGATSCAFIQEVDASAGCAAQCENGAAVFCSLAGRAFATTCGAPVYSDASACFAGKTLDGSPFALCVAPGAACTNACEGDASLAHRCIGGLSYIANCNVSGRACGVDTSGLPRCLGPNGTPICSEGAVAYDCDGDSVRFCFGPVAGEFDCTATGRKCSINNPAELPACVLPSGGCTPFDASVNVCAGSSISLCTGGAPSSFDCAQIGQTCQPASGASSAHCG